MTIRAVARRYARALFEVSLAEADPRQVERELDTFVGLVQRHAELWRALTHPAVSPSRKRAAVASLVEHAAPLSPVLAKLLLLLAERDRLKVLPDLLEAYRERVLEHRRVIRAQVATAIPLSDDRLRALAEGLARATGREVQVEARVDPSLIGGAVARLGSLVVDGSLARQLERAKAELAAAGER